MPRKLPPLNAIRAFEAAGRHGSFAHAALELNVTPAAVSHQVKGLEEFLGITLFDRLARGLVLTDAGRAALPALREGLDRVDEAFQQITHGQSGKVLTVRVSPSFAADWLVPRLGRFRRAVPGFDLRVRAPNNDINFDKDVVDLVVAYHPTAYAGYRVERLAMEEVFPVCAPDLAAAQPLHTPNDLRHHTLLHDETMYRVRNFPDWPMWLDFAGVRGLDAQRGPRLSYSNLVLQAAIDGAGVALGRSVLVADALATGRLIKPFDVSYPANFGYYVISLVNSPNRDKIELFCDWLFAEMGTARAPRGADGALPA